jgi:hypothetical protein
MDCATDCAVCPLASEKQVKPSLSEPADDVADFVLLIACRVRAALALLVEGCDYAKGFNCKPADFPVEVAELQEAGLTGNDLRGLLYAGILQQVTCPPGRSATGGKGPGVPGAVIPQTACFILTVKGLALSRQVLATTPSFAVVAALPDSSTNGRAAAPLRPTWDTERHELYLGPTLVKQFKVPAINQLRILDAFEEECWPPRVDDPLPGIAGTDAKRRLHDTIYSLNGKQAAALIRFLGDGTGMGIRWELREAIQRT